MISVSFLEYRFADIYEKKHGRTTGYLPSLVIEVYFPGKASSPDALRPWKLRLWRKKSIIGRNAEKKHSSRLYLIHGEYFEMIKKILFFSLSVFSIH
jgi:hypothetical protein